MTRATRRRIIHSTPSPSLFARRSRRRRIAGSPHAPRMEPLERRLLLSTLVIDGTDGNDLFNFILTNDQTTLQVAVTNSQGTTINEHDFATISKVVVSGVGGDDTFNVDFSGGNPVPYGGSFNVNGDGQTTPLGDKLILTSLIFDPRTPNFRTISYSGLPGIPQGHNGVINLTGGQYGSGLINFTGLEPVSLNVTTTTLNVSLPIPDVHAILEDEGTNVDGMNFLRSANNTFESVSFNSTLLTELNIEFGSGNDVFEALTPDSTFAAAAAVNTGEGADAVEILFNGTDADDVVSYFLTGAESTLLQINTLAGNDSIIIGGDITPLGSILAGDGDDSIDTVMGVGGTPTGLVTDGQNGSDRYTLRLNDGAVTDYVALDSGLTGSDTLTVVGTDANENFTLDELSVQREAGGVVSQVRYAGFESAGADMAGGDDNAFVQQALGSGITSAGFVLGGDGSDTFNPASSPFAQLTYDGQNGSDIYTLLFSEVDAGNSGPQADMSDTGTTGTDTLTILGTDADENYTVTGSSLSRSITMGTTNVAFTGMEEIELDMAGGDDTAIFENSGGFIEPCWKTLGGPGFDTFLVRGSDFAELTLDGGEDPDRYELFFGALAGEVILTDTGLFGENNLMIHATDNADILTLTANSPLSINWRPADGSAAPEVITVAPGFVDALELSGGAGDDSISSTGVPASLNILLVLRGGAGNDDLKGGAGTEILLGEEGNDSVHGHQGRDILIGGDGADRVVGNEGEDIIIAGYTLHDHNLTALRALFAEWNSERDYQTRIANLSGNGSGPRNNGNFFLNNLSVLDDGDVDVLTGASGRDWFFANTAGGDVITDMHTPETLTQTALPGL